MKKLLMIICCFFTVTASAAISELTPEQFQAVQTVKKLKLKSALNKTFKLKDGTEVNLAELEALMDMGIDVTLILESTAAGEGSGFGTESVSGKSSGFSYGLSPLSPMSGGGGSSVSRN